CAAPGCGGAPSGGPGGERRQLVPRRHPEVLEPCADGRARPRARLLVLDDRERDTVGERADGIDDVLREGIGVDPPAAGGEQRDGRLRRAELELDADLPLEAVEDGGGGGARLRRRGAAPGRRGTRA